MVPLMLPVVPAGEAFLRLGHDVAVAPGAEAGIQHGASATAGGEQLIAERVEDHRIDRLAVLDPLDDAEQDGIDQLHGLFRVLGSRPGNVRAVDLALFEPVDIGVVAAQALQADQRTKISRA